MSPRSSWKSQFAFCKQNLAFVSMQTPDDSILSKKEAYLVLCLSIQLLIQPCVHCFSLFASSVYGVQPTVDRRYLGKCFKKLSESRT